jgi:hypothetical protein
MMCAFSARRERDGGGGCWQPCSQPAPLGEAVEPRPIRVCVVVNGSVWGLATCA